MAVTADPWDSLVRKYGEVLTFCGAETADYWASGRASWRAVEPFLPFGDAPKVLEWGAGSGRMTRPALESLPAGGELWAYEPSAEARALLTRNAPGAWSIGPGELETVPADLTHLFCIFTMHHMDYDALWEFFGFAETHLAPGGVMVFDYIPITTDVGRSFLARKDRSEWPSYIWHPEQVASLLAVRAPSLEHKQTVDRPRELQVWSKA